MTSNPFRPSFGVTPPALVGRDTEILAFGDALTPAPARPGRATLYTGVRGIGKTVMLNEAETQARQRGWVVVSETAVPGLIDRLTAQRLPEAAATLELSSTGRRVTAVAFPFHLGGLTWQPPAAEHRPDLRAQLTALTDHLAEHEPGCYSPSTNSTGPTEPDCENLPPPSSISSERNGPSHLPARGSRPQSRIC